MIRVNLLAQSPGAKPVRRELVPTEQRSAATGLVLLLLTGAGVGVWWWQISQARAEVEAGITAAEGELARLKTAAKLVETATGRRSELAERLALIERLREFKRAPVSLLQVVSESLPDGLWLLELRQQGAAVQLEGRAVSLTAVTDFAERMQNSPFFKKPVEILSTAAETVDDTAVVRFTVRAEAASMPALPEPPPTGRGAGRGARGTANRPGI